MYLLENIDCLSNHVEKVPQPTRIDPIIWSSFQKLKWRASCFLVNTRGDKKLEQLRQRELEATAFCFCDVCLCLCLFQYLHFCLRVCLCFCHCDKRWSMPRMLCARGLSISTSDWNFKLSTWVHCWKEELALQVCVGQVHRSPKLRACTCWKILIA